MLIVNDLGRDSCQPLVACAGPLKVISVEVAETEDREHRTVLLPCLQDCLQDADGDRIVPLSNVRVDLLS